MLSVADEMALDGLLNSLTDMERASIERAARSRFTDHGAIDRSYHRGYYDGVNDGREQAKREAAEDAKKAKKPSGDTPPAAAI